MGFHAGRSSAPSALTFPPRPPTPRYLLSHGANIAAVNSDGDLPLDLAESDAMEGLLKAEIAYRGRPPGAVGTGRVSCPRILSLCLGFLSCAVEGESSRSIAWDTKRVIIYGACATAGRRVRATRW